MRHALLVAMVVAGCAPQSERAAVLPDRLRLSAVENGRFTVTGQAGAVLGQPYGVTFTVRREGGVKGYRTQHLSGEGFPVTSGFALVQPDGSFPPTVLGDADNAVRAGDELNVRPMMRKVIPGLSVQLADTGENVALHVP